MERGFLVMTIDLLLLAGLGLAGSEELLNAVVAGSQLLASVLGLSLLQLGQLLLLEGDGGLGVSLGEDLTAPVGARTLGDAELVALEVSGGGESSLGSQALSLLGGGELGQDVLLGEGSLDL